jgi:hypothetical protein
MKVYGWQTGTHAINSKVSPSTHWQVNKLLVSKEQVLQLSGHFTQA